MRYVALCLPTLLVAASIAFAEPAQINERAIGTYTRQSRVCGGPGSADGPASCSLVFEDTLEIRKRLVVQTDNTTALDVSFIVHYAYMDQCRFEGRGIWSAGKLRLTSTDGSSVAPSCRLSLLFSDNRVQVLDPGGICARDLCVTPAGHLNGVAFRRKK